MKKATKEPTKVVNNISVDNKVFQTFSNAKLGYIDQEGMMALFQKLELDLTDSFIGYLLYLMKCNHNDLITKEQLSVLLNYVKADTVQELKKKIPQLQKEYASPENFKKVYEYMFDLTKERQDSKTINFDMAEQIWTLYLRGKFQLYEQFMEFLGQIKERKSINKDTWNMLLEFNNIVGKDITKHREEDFWPTMIDNFAEFVRNKKK